jgi:hypothetical protein
MIQTSSRALLTVGRAVGVLLAAEAATFLLAALTHLGVGIPLGFGVLHEPRIVDATVVEGLCALLLATAAYAVLTHRAWAWLAATVAHSFAIAGGAAWDLGAGGRLGPDDHHQHHLPPNDPAGAGGWPGPAPDLGREGGAGAALTPTKHAVPSQRPPWPDRF